MRDRTRELDDRTAGRGPVPRRAMPIAALRATVLAAALMLPVTGPAGAETTAALPETVLAAIGWLGPADAAALPQGGCTGVLVAPDLVLTAAHCLARDDGRPPGDPGLTVFLPGYPQAAPAAMPHGRDVILTAPRALLGGRLPYDLALLRLDRAVAGVAPLPLTRGLSDDAGGVTVVGYPHGATINRDLRSGCKAEAAPPVVALSCPVVPGYSGGPVLVMADGVWQVAAIVVARAGRGAATAALAVMPAEDLRAAIPAP